jgi:hypothetical protein
MTARAAQNAEPAVDPWLQLRSLVLASLAAAPVIAWPSTGSSATSKGSWPGTGGSSGLAAIPPSGRRPVSAALSRAKRDYWLRGAIPANPAQRRRARFAPDGLSVASVGRARGWRSRHMFDGEPSSRPPGLSGAEEQLRALLGDGVADLRITRREFVFRSRSPPKFVEVFRDYYELVRKAFDAPDQSGRGRLYHDLAALAVSHNREPGPSLAIPSEYVEAIADVR